MITICLTGAFYIGWYLSLVACCCCQMLLTVQYTHTSSTTMPLRLSSYLVTNLMDTTNVYGIQTNKNCHCNNNRLGKNRDILAKGKFFQEMQHLETITQKKDVLKKIMHTPIYIYIYIGMAELIKSVSKCVTQKHPTS